MKRVLAALLTAGAATAAIAGGPISTYDSTNRIPYAWNMRAWSGQQVPVYTDLGELGVLDTDHADKLVRFAAGQWSSVKTASFKATLTGDFSDLRLDDVNASNIGSVIGTFNGGGIHVIYDSDGSILSTVFGVPPTAVLGITDLEWVANDSPEILEAWMVLSGPGIRSNDPTGIGFAGVVTHEMGHALNLAHTQANGAALPSSLRDPAQPTGCEAPWTGGPDDTQSETMYPFITPEPGGTGASMATVEHLDDTAALSDLYPAPGWPESRGTIRGQVLDVSGNPVTGVNVIARNISDPFFDCTSYITGQVSKGEAGPDGSFVMNGLTPGASYVLYVDQLMDGAFSVPRPIVPPGPEEYFNGPMESGDGQADDRCAWSPTLATAGSPVALDMTFNHVPGAPTFITAPALGVQSVPIDITADGSVVVGGAGLDGPVFRWDVNANTFDVIGGNLAAECGISDDGLTIVANVIDTDGVNKAAIYENDAWTVLPSVPGAVACNSSDAGPATTLAYDISGDGSTVVGLSFGSQGCGGSTIRGFRWTAADGTVALPKVDAPSRPSRANAVNYDGSVIVGWDDANNGQRRGVQWRDGAPSLIKRNNLSVGESLDVSRDGRFIVGHSNTSATNSNGWLWSQSSGVQLLGAIPGQDSGLAAALNDDASVITGQSLDFDAGIITPTIWTSGLGLMDFNLFLSAQGVVTTGLGMRLGMAMSADGRTITGYSNSRIGYLGWVLKAPTVLVCHTPDGSPTQLQTTIVSFPQGMDAALASGDTLGPCPITASAPAESPAPTLGNPDAQAQTLLTTHANVLAVTDRLVPGPSGAYFGTAFDSPVVADDGTVLFRANMYGGDVSGTGNARALFRGTTAANLSLLVRSSDPAPGLANLMLVNGAGNNGIQGGAMVSPDGRTFWSSYLTGPGVASNNDTAMFGGLPGSLVPIVREGDAAPGTSGAVFSGDRITSTQFTTMNRNGAVLFQSTLSGGDVVVGTNDQGLFTGTAGALSMVVRKGDTVLAGPVTASAFAGQLSMNTGGQVLYNLTLAGAGVTLANNGSLALYTPGTGNVVLVREGQPAPGTAGATFNDAFDTWVPSVPPSGFNNSGQYVMTAVLQGGDVVSGVNDNALYVGSASGSLTMVARKGDPAPGTDAVFAGFVTNNTYINNAGVVLTVGLLMGGTSSSASNAAVYVATPTGIPATPYTLSLVMRAGDPAPGTPGDIFGPLFNQATAFNDSGQAVFNRDLRGGDAMFGINDKGVYGWDPVKGLFLIARTGDQVQVAPGLFWTAGNFGYLSNSNTDGSALGLSKTGTLAMNVSWTDGGSSVVTVDLRCYPVYYPDADGDGYGDASSTNGVCSNASPPAGSVPNHTDCNDANPAVFATYYQDVDGDGYGNASVSVCDDATPPTGYVPYGTDCNVLDPQIHPDRSDESCDGVDQNCNGANDEGYLDHQSFCGVGACASLGVARCQNGVVNDTCVPGAPSTETCNGIDDNCDGTVDNAAAPTGMPSVSLGRISGSAASLTWSSVSGATGYDITRGNLVTLRASSGNFATSTINCLGNNISATTINDLQSVAVGQGFWYLLRAVNCGGNASYDDSGSPDQAASRNAGIAASGVACP